MFTEGCEVSCLFHTTNGSLPTRHTTPHIPSAMITTNSHRSTITKIVHQSIDTFSVKHGNFSVALLYKNLKFFFNLVDASSTNRTRIWLNWRHMRTLCLLFNVGIGHINFWIVLFELNSCFALSIGFQVVEFLTFWLYSDFPSRRMSSLMSSLILIAELRCYQTKT